MQCAIGDGEDLHSATFDLRLNVGAPGVQYAMYVSPYSVQRGGGGCRVCDLWCNLFNVMTTGIQVISAKWATYTHDVVGVGVYGIQCGAKYCCDGAMVLHCKKIERHGVSGKQLQYVQHVAVLKCCIGAKWVQTMMQKIVRRGPLANRALKTNFVTHFVCVYCINCGATL